MTFYEVLAQALDLLQREGRVSYRALKRQFSLDDEYLEDLKVEILDVKRLAVDQDGTMLVWTGAPVSLPAPEREAGLSPEVSQDQTTPHDAPEAGRDTIEAERRQITVLFCDLVGSTALASQLDPEDFRAVVRAYQATCAEVIQRYDGHIAQYLGDGLLVYFGYPLAHEDDASRAVRAGLEIVEEIGRLPMRLPHHGGVRGTVPLRVRLGIHTGMVVVGEIGAEARREQLAIGEPPNLAARLQGLAEPDTVVISATTYRLSAGFFACRSLGAHTLKGITTPVEVYRVLDASGAQSRFEVAVSAGLTPLVGREEEVELLLR